MEAALFNKMYIANAIFSFQYMPYMDIEREMVLFENGLKGLFDNRAELTRVPRHAAPQIPRFVFQNKSGKKLEVAPMKTTLSFNFKNIGMEKAKNLFQKDVKGVFSFLKKQDWIKIDTFNSATIIHIPLKDKKYNLLNDIKKEFIKFPSEDELIKTALSIKVKKTNHYYEYVIGEYSEIHHEFKIDKNEMPPTPQNEVYVKIKNEDGKLLEKGLRLSLIIEDIFDSDSMKNINIANSFKLLLEDTKEEVESAPRNIIFNGGQ